MTLRDSRTTLALRCEGAAASRLAAQSEEGLTSADRYRATSPRQVIAGIASLRRAPSASAEQISQVLFGEGFDVLTLEGEFAFGQACRDGYVGWVTQSDLGLLEEPPTHWVRALRTYAFQSASIKSPVRHLLSQNAFVRVVGEVEGVLVEIAGAGWVPVRHLAPMGDAERDPAAVALAYLAAPYLWGGRSSLGLDCSGLVQQALFACAQAAPRDSDMQSGLGQPITPGPDLSGLGRNDLVFWRGHVGLMLDGQTLIHANAYHMAVAVEPLAEAVRRIEAAGSGRPTAFRRLPEFAANSGEAKR